MFVRESGDGGGAPLVLIPGLGCDHTMYQPQYAELDAFRCLAVDLRGTGRSGTLEGIAIVDIITRQAAEVVEALDERSIESAHIVGVSYGGAVAQELLLRHPDRVRSVAICDSLCDTRPRTMPERLLMWGAKTQPFLYRMPRGWLAALVRRSYRRWPAAGKAMADAVSTARRDDLIAQRRAINAIRYEDELREASCPALCMVGDHAPQAIAMMHRVHDAIAGSEFHVIADSFDPSNLCQPDAFTAMLRRWVIGVERHRRA
ncbi:alpha/beta fold hydrolase [Paramicrobacterium fandaimingii]|uniref:alpha/beta fold hydrolase n=1 Tax=Paramicrobacterium fandaimingii TaxID=2708079 RepID=UPI0014231CAE|nr:alpha/beta hydrolase [Microbacterium fandaimingii]